MPWEPEYITPTQLGNYIRGSVAASLTDLETACASASTAVNDAAGRQFGKTDAAEARYYRARWSATKALWYVETDDFMSVAGMTVDFDSAADGTFATSIALTGIMKHPANAAAKNEPWQGFYLRPAVSTGVDGRPQGFRALTVWGWSSVPETIVDATKLQGSRFVARRDAPFGVAGSPNDGSETRLLAKADPDVKVMVRKKYARRAWAR